MKMVQTKFAAAIANGGVTLHQNAVSNVSGLTLTLHDAGDSSSVESSAVGAGLGVKVGAKHSVSSVTLDEIVGSRAVAVLKADVQGHELEVMLGAHHLLSRPPRAAPLVVLEYYEHLRPELGRHELLHLMRGYGYTCYDISAGNQPLWKFVRPGNELFSHAQCMAQYPALLKSLGYWEQVKREWLQRLPAKAKKSSSLSSWLWGASEPSAGFGCPKQLSTDFACAKIKGRAAS